MRDSPLEASQTVPEMMASAAEDVRRIKKMKAELAILIERVRRTQRRLADNEVMLDFPILHEVVNKSEPLEMRPPESTAEEERAVSRRAVNIGPEANSALESYWGRASRTP